MSAIGQVVAGLQVVRRLARGSQAEVFLASDGTRHRALKLFAPRYAHRAERELRYGRGLEHPNLNPVETGLALGARAGVLTPYLAGERLDRCLLHEPRARLLGHVVGVLEGLAYLHARGVVHRDVKFENVIVTPAGRAVLFDFDLSVGLAEASERVSAGTLPYLSPEQARGEPASPSSDLYAVGVLLYRILTGELPFPEAGLAALEGSLGPMGSLVRRLLAEREDGRFARAEEAAAVLRALL